MTLFPGVEVVEGETGVVMRKIEGSSDPAAALLDRVPRTPQTVYRADCYICVDDEFARMGLPLCNPCPICSDGHVPADDSVCTDCDGDLGEWYLRRERRASSRAMVLAVIEGERRAEAYARQQRQRAKTSSRRAVRQEAWRWRRWKRQAYPITGDFVEPIDFSFLEPF